MAKSSHNRRANGPKSSWNRMGLGGLLGHTHIRVGKSGSSKWVRVDKTGLGWIGIGHSRSGWVLMDNRGFRLVKMNHIGLLLVRVDPQSGSGWVKVDKEDPGWSKLVRVWIKVTQSRLK